MGAVPPLTSSAAVGALESPPRLKLRPSPPNPASSRPKPLRQQLFHALLRGQELRLVQARAELQHEQVLRAPKAADHVEVDLAGADRLVVVSVDTDIVEMETDRVRGVLLEMRAVVEQAHVVLDLGMARVVPVAAGVGLGHGGEKLGMIRINRQLVEGLAVLEAQLDAFLLR